MTLSFLMNALVAALVVGILAYIADFFLGKSGLGFPRQFVWLIALVVWVLVVFEGGLGLR
jgi:hypothetical protein